MEALTSFSFLSILSSVGITIFSYKPLIYLVIIYHYHHLQYYCNSVVVVVVVAAMLLFAEGPTPGALTTIRALKS